MNSKKKVCCLILNYNDSDTTIKLLESIKNLTVFSDILIVDNCSSDSSYETLSYLSKEEYTNLTVIRNKKNGGYGAGNNFGIKYAYDVLRVDYVLLSNPDVVFTEELVVKLKNVLLDSNNVAAVSAVQFDIAHKPIDTVAWSIPTPLEYALSTTRLYKLFQGSYCFEDVCNKEKVFVECIPGALVMYDARKFLEVGGYDENMFLYCEEVTIAIKFKERGYKTVLLGKEKYYHEHSVSINKAIQSKIRQTELIFHNRIYVMENYMESPKIWIRMAVLLQNRRIKKMKKQL